MIPRENDETEPAWSVVKMTGTMMNHPWLVRDPKCPHGRHPTRDCGCKVFRFERLAQAYADSHGGQKWPWES